MILGALLIVIGIVFGAFGAHALKEVLSPERLVSFETGVRYQMYHGLAILILGVAENKIVISKWSKRLMLAGVILFSGSIYLLAVQDLLGISMKFLGPITPVGGVLLIVSWVLILINLIQSKDT